MANSYAITARRSGAQNATVDNGRAQITVGGDSVQPTELVLGGLGSCMMSMIVDYAVRNEIPTDGVGVEVTGEMESGPRRIARIHAAVTVPDGLSQRHVEALLRAAERCPVHATLAESPAMTVALAPATDHGGREGG